MARYEVTLNIAHDPLTWRESRYFESQEFNFNSFAEIQQFAKEKLEDKSLPRSGGHYIEVVLIKDNGERGHWASWKYARWCELAFASFCR